MLTFTCPSCSYEIKAKEEYAGKAGKCKHCGESVRVPEKPISIFDSPEYQEKLKKAEEEMELRNKQAQQPVQQILYVQYQGMNTAKIIIAISSLVGMMATFLPWVTVPIGGSINGSAGDGWFSFAFFSVALLIAVSGYKHQKIGEYGKFFIIILSFASIALFIMKYFDFRIALGEIEYKPLARSIQLGIGLYLVGIAGLVNFITLCIANKEPATIAQN